MAQARHPSDSKNLIYESYRIEGIRIEECRSIFMDWALSLSDDDAKPHLRFLLGRYGAEFPDHPMTQVLREGLERAAPSGRRGGRAGRFNQG